MLATVTETHTLTMTWPFSFRASNRNQSRQFLLPRLVSIQVNTKGIYYVLQCFYDPPPQLQIMCCYIALCKVKTYARAPRGHKTYIPTKLGGQNRSLDPTNERIHDNLTYLVLNVKS